LHYPDYDAWLRRFETALGGLPENERQQSFLSLLHRLRHLQKAIAGTAVSAQRFRAAVQQYGAGSFREIPSISRALIRKCLADLKLVGLLP
jgi:fatty acid CoA ligase FadD9